MAFGWIGDLFSSGTGTGSVSGAGEFGPGSDEWDTVTPGASEGLFGGGMTAANVAALQKGLGTFGATASKAATPAEAVPHGGAASMHQAAGGGQLAAVIAALRQRQQQQQAGFGPPVRSGGGLLGSF